MFFVATDEEVEVVDETPLAESPPLLTAVPNECTCGLIVAAYGTEVVMPLGVVVATDVVPDMGRIRRTRVAV
jgi:hypothetical protein